MSGMCLKLLIRKKFITIKTFKQQILVLTKTLISTRKVLVKDYCKFWNFCCTIPTYEEILQKIFSCSGNGNTTKHGI